MFLSPRMSRKPADAIPALPFQKQLWLMQRLSPEVGVANISSVLTWTGPLDLQSLQAATFDFVQRHPYIRTTIESTDLGELVQVEHEPSATPLTVIDLQHLSGEELAQERGRLLAQVCETPLDATVSPLVRCVALRTSPQRHDITFIFSHLTCDGLSTGVICREFLQAYQARLDGRAPVWVSPMPDSLVQNYSESVFAKLPFAVHPSHGSHDELSLADFVSRPGYVSSDPTKPSESMYRGQRFRFNVSQLESDLVNGVSRQFGVSPFVTWLTLFQIVLNRYTHREDFQIDVVRSGRTAGQRRMVGPLFETLAVSLDFDRQTTFSELLLDNQRRIEAMNQIGPLENRLPQSRSRILLDYQSALQPVELDGGVTVTAAEMDNGAAVAELCLGIRRNKKRFSGHIKFDISLFDTSTVASLVDHLRQCLTNACTNHASRVGDIEFLTTAEIELINSVNQTESASDRFEFVDQQIMWQAKHRPNAVAIVAANKTWKYAELALAVLDITRRLRHLDVVRGDRVGIQLPRGPKCLAAIIATMRIGAAFVPLGLDWPLARQKSVAEQARLNCIVCDSNAPLLNSFVKRLSVDELTPNNSGETTDDCQPIERDPGDTAYVMFTSGSGGVPKGVEVTHANLCNFFAGVDSLQNESIPGRWLAVTNLTFDISVFELVWTLARGFQVVILPKDQATSSFASFVAQYAITHFQCTPALLQLICQDATNRTALSKLLHVYVGGDVLPQTLADKLMATGAKNVFNMYGPTETTIWSSGWKLQHHQPVRIGKPLPNQTVFVLDHSLRPVPLGLTGELFVGGAGVAKGYLGDPTKTANRFVEHPEWGRIYRTGDLVRMCPDGNLEFIGRKDRQIKRFGHRFELGDIESTAKQCRGLRECAVEWVENRASGQLVFYYCSDNGVTQDSLKHFLQNELPRYMLPDRFVSVSQMPLNGSGKIDRLALSRLFENEVAETAQCNLENGPLPTGHIGPGRFDDHWRHQVRNQLIKTIVAELKLEWLPLDQNWSQLGIDSMDVVSLVVRLERETGMAFPVANLFRDERIGRTIEVVLASARPDQIGTETDTAAHAPQFEEGVI